jgi:transcriptional regulator with XRE-family HTH domain
MISETLASGLEQYRIGAKVRALRKEKKLGLVQLGEHTGLSPGMLSKIERGQLFPTLPTLMRIALVFGVGLEHFFVESAERPTVAVVRREERLRLPDRAGEPTPSYFFESLDFPATERRMEAFHADFPAQSRPSAPHRHEGAEFLYVLKGRLAVEVDGRRIRLDEGDAMYFDSDQPHSYRREGPSPCSVIVVVTK